MWRCPLTSCSSLTPSLNSSGGGSSGKGHGSEQVGLHQRWDVKSWHTTDHESLEARAVYQRGRQEATGHGFRFCGNNLSRGCMTVVVQLFPNGCLSVSVGLCLSWPVGTWNPSWLSQCYRGRRIHFLSLHCLFWLLQPFCMAPSCCLKTCLWAVGT